MQKCSRRKFIETSLLGSLAPLPALLQATDQDTDKQSKLSKPTPNNRWASLIPVMDTLIPEAHGMPCASKAGCERYLIELSDHDQNVKQELNAILEMLDHFVTEARKERFSNISKADRLSVLKMFEREQGDEFEKLRLYTYEAYYSQPVVRRMIGYEPHPTNGSGVSLRFDEKVLSTVRNRTKHYREV